MTLTSYRHCLFCFLEYIEKKGKRIKELTREDILDYISYLKQKGLTPNSLSVYMHRVKGFFKHLEADCYILINPTDDLVIKRVPPKNPVVLSEKEMKKLIDQPNTSTRLGIRDRAMFEVLYSTGIRLKELNNLTIFDIDTSNGFLRVNKGKFSKDRFSPLSRAACYWLNQYIKHVRPRLTKNNPRENALFVGYCSHKKLNPLIIERKVKDFAKLAGIKKRVTPHTFRHTFATHMLENGADIVKIQNLLGHRHLSVTQRYTTVTVKGVKQEHTKHHPREKEKE